MTDMSNQYKPWPHPEEYIQQKYLGEIGYKPSAPKSRVSNNKKPLAPHVQKAIERINNRNKELVSEEAAVTIPEVLPTKTGVNITTQKVPVHVRPVLATQSPAEPSRLSSLLDRAEGLLSQMNTLAKPQSEPEGAPVIYMEQKPTPPSHLRSNEIDLLISGVSDAYDESDIDDDAVHRIISLGGAPPSQLQFQSLYALNQRTLHKLATVRYLNLHLNTLIVYDAKYAIRKETSFLTVKGPAGSLISFSNIERIPLRPPEQVVATRKDLRGKNTNNFIVGSVSVDKALAWEVQFTDDLVAQWMEGDKADCLLIEIHSTLLPVGKGPKPDSHVFGHVYVPIASLLGMDTLAAAFSCEFEVNTLVQDTVAARMKNLPSGYKFGKKASTPKMGSLSARVWLQASDESYLKADQLSKVKDPVLLIAEPSRRLPSSTHQTPSPAEQQLTEAMSYLPMEAPPQTPDKTVSSPQHIGFCFHSLVIKMKASLFAAAKVPRGTPLKINIAYKLSPIHHESIEGFGVYERNPTSLAGDGILFDLLTIKQFTVGVETSLPQLLELWLEWIDPISCKLCKKLAGVGSFAMQEGLTSIDISDILTEETVGVLKLSVYADADAGAVQERLESATLSVEIAHIETTRLEETSQDLGSDEESAVIRAGPDASYLTEEEVSPVPQQASTANALIMLLKESLAPAVTETVREESAVATQSLASSFPTVRVLDLKISNCASLQVATADDIELGAFIQYSLASSAMQSGNESGAAGDTWLWWDKECGILNGRAQHKFRFSSPRQLDTFLQSGVSLRVMSSNDATAGLVGTATIDPATLTRIFLQSSEVIIDLFVMSADRQSIIGTLSLSLAHHIEPVLLRSSEFATMRRSIESNPALTSTGFSLAIIVDRCMHLMALHDSVNGPLQCNCRWASPFDSAIQQVSTSQVDFSVNPNWDEELHLPLPFNLNADEELDLKKFIECRLLITLMASAEVVGVAEVDVSLLAYGIPAVEGWYNIVDKYHCSIGQIKLNVQVSTGSPIAPIQDSEDVTLDEDMPLFSLADLNAQLSATLAIVTERAVTPHLSEYASSSGEFDDSVLFDEPDASYGDSSMYEEDTDSEAELDEEDTEATTEPQATPTPHHADPLEPIPSSPTESFSPQGQSDNAEVFEQFSTSIEPENNLDDSSDSSNYSEVQFEPKAKLDFIAELQALERNIELPSIMSSYIKEEVEVHNEWSETMFQQEPPVVVEIPVVQDEPLSIEPLVIRPELHFPISPEVEPLPSVSPDYSSSFISDGDINYDALLNDYTLEADDSGNISRTSPDLADLEESSGEAKEVIGEYIVRDDYISAEESLASGEPVDPSSEAEAAADPNLLPAMIKAIVAATSIALSAIAVDEEAAGVESEVRIEDPGADVEVDEEPLRSVAAEPDLGAASSIEVAETAPESAASVGALAHEVAMINAMDIIVSDAVVSMSFADAEEVTSDTVATEEPDEASLQAPGDDLLWPVAVSEPDTIDAEPVEVAVKIEDEANADREEASVSIEDLLVHEYYTEELREEEVLMAEDEPTTAEVLPSLPLPIETEKVMLESETQTDVYETHPEVIETAQVENGSEALETIVRVTPEVSAPEESSDSSTSFPSESSMRNLIAARVEKAVARNMPEVVKKAIVPHAPKQSPARPMIITPEFIEAELSRLLPQSSHAEFRVENLRRRNFLDSEMDRVSRIMREIPTKIES